jgi:hypothetical protein
MVDKNIFHTPVRMGCMLVLSIFVFLTGCSAIGQRGDAVSILDRELAASVVHVQGNEGPEQLNRLVQPGTVVMWLNKCGEDIRIVFPERKVTIACLNPVSFSVNEEGFFESKVLSPGAVASLCFIQPGLYAYVVERQADARREQPEGLRLEGTIVVQ